MFAQLFSCPTHGEVWQVEPTEIIDTENDEVYHITVCAKCYKEVSPVLHNGLPVSHALSDEDMFWEMYSEEEEW